MVKSPCGKKAQEDAADPFHFVPGDDFEIEDFDPDEMHWLNTLAAAAGAAYDHLAADALRQELERVTRENESQRLMLERNGLKGYLVAGGLERIDGDLGRR